MSTICLLTLVPLSLLAGQDCKEGQEGATGSAGKLQQIPAVLQQSKAVQVEGAEFRTAAEPRCTVLAGDAIQWFMVGLTITNARSSPLQFKLFETFEPVLKSADGKVFQAEWEREETCPMDPVLVKPGHTETILLPASCAKSWNRVKGLCLYIRDGSGGEFSFEGVVPGKYSLSFVYVNLSTVAGAAGEAPPFWAGNVVTPEVEFEIVAPKQ